MINSIFKRHYAHKIKTTMKKQLYILLILSTFSISGLYAQQKASKTDSIIKLATKEYEEGNKEQSKQLFLKAIDFGSIEACYLITYYNNLPQKEEMKYLLKASINGHEKAFKRVFMKYFFGANLRMSNPSLVYDVYKKALSNNSDFYGGEYIEYLEMCMEVEPFDVDEFSKKYKIEVNGQDPFEAWYLAEEASINGKFGKPSSKLVLQLVSRGGLGYIATQDAIEFAYANWKNNTNEPFDLCSFVSSGVGTLMCTSRDFAENEKRMNNENDSLKNYLNNNSQIYFDQAYSLAVDFYDMEQNYESIMFYGYNTHGIAHALYAIDQLKVEYIALIKQINNQSFDGKWDDSINWDDSLNLVYNNLIKLIREPIRNNTNGRTLSRGNIRNVQRSWLKYRDSSAKLFHNIDTSKAEIYWKNWLTQKRVSQLEILLERINSEILY